MDRFAKTEDAEKLAAEERRRKLTTPLLSKDALFQNVLQACVGGPVEECKDDCLRALKKIRRRSKLGSELWSIDDVFNTNGYSLLGQAVVDRNHHAISCLVDVKASLNKYDKNGENVNPCSCLCS